MFCRLLFVLLGIVLSALLRYTVSDCPFCIFKLFLWNQWECFTVQVQKKNIHKRAIFNRKNKHSIIPNEKHLEENVYKINKPEAYTFLYCLPDDKMVCLINIVVFWMFFFCNQSIGVPPRDQEGSNKINGMLSNLLQNTSSSGNRNSILG
jgi:hypothetical protein